MTTTATHPTNIEWNLYAEIIDNRVTNLIMPDAEGNLIEQPAGEGWYAVRWPVNPHFTGETVIRMVLDDRFRHRVRVAR